MSEEAKTEAATTAAGAPRKINVKQLLDAAQVQKDVAINPSDLSSAMINQAGFVVHYGSIAAQASAQVDKFKLFLEAAEAKVYRTLREEADTASKKVTEAQLGMNVSAHPSIQAIKGALNEAKQIESAAKTVFEAFKHRRDMLIQMGLISREEMKGEASVSVRRTAEKAADDSANRVLDRITAERESPTH